MNPLFLLLLGFGGFMSFMGFSGDDATDTIDAAATRNPDPDPAPAPEAPEEPAPATAPEMGELIMVIYDMKDRRIVEEISDSETVDFGTTSVENFVIASEMADGSEIGSMLLTWNDQTWLQNIYPFTLEEAAIDLTEGD